MTSAPAAGAGPSIRIVLDADGAPRIAHRRPLAVRALIGRPPSDALTAVPLLLPICGEAQRIAAARAVEAARAEPASAEVERWREIGLAAEQAVSIAWRLAIDWPAVVGAPADVSAVKDVRESVKPLAAAAKCAETGEAPPAIDEAIVATADRLRGLAEPAAAETLDRLLDEVAADTSTVAAALRAAKAAPQDLGAHSGRRLADVDLVALAAAAISQDTFDLAAPSGEAIEVGPFAASQDPVVVEAERRFGPGAFARLLAYARAALQWRDDAKRAARGGGGLPGAPVGERRGVGAALTARGPVVHWVALDGPRDAPVIADWRAVAPTDWHFASNGPIVSTFRPFVGFDLKQRDAALCVASFDPCAPCHVEAAGNA